MPKAVPEKDTLDAGFSKVWLARAFRTTRYFVDKLLASVEPKGKAGKAALYDLKDAAEFLVAGEIRWDELLKRLNKRDLPANLQTEIWAARRAEKKYRLEAGDLWPTESVLDTISSVFGMIRSTTRVWSEAMERETGLTADQRKLLAALVDQLMRELHDEVLRLAEENSSTSALDELRDKI